MYGQIKLIDGIHTFVPTRETWAAKPIEALPEKVTVSFKTGQTGVLDMKNPVATVWAEMLDFLNQTQKPVYVEIDPETKIITQLIIPETGNVLDLTPLENGDIDINLAPSAAPHYIRHTNPEFASLRQTLQAAKDDGSEVLVTSTPEEHEIIDVKIISKTEEAP